MLNESNVASEVSGDILRQSGYRFTLQRYLIVSILQETQGHLTIEQLTHLVQEQNPRISQATIYRTLDLLQALKLVQATHLAGRKTCYEISKGQAHHHIICRKCREVQHLDEFLLGSLPEQLEAQYQVHDLTLELLATGYCKECWQIVQKEQKFSDEYEK